jgi:hypothetical protein
MLQLLVGSAEVAVPETRGPDVRGLRLGNKRLVARIAPKVGPDMDDRVALAAIKEENNYGC